MVALGEGELAVCSVLGRLDGRIAALADFDAGLADVRELISAAAIQADEALHALRRYRDRLDLDPGRLAELERRIAAVMEAARKYRVQPEELPALAQQWRERLDTLEATADPARLAAAAQAAQAGYDAAAAKLSAARIPAARRLSAEIAAAMQDLAMAGGRFEVALEPCAPSAAGGEAVEFRVAANAGQPLRSLAKVASGGELSRISLAIEVAALGSDAVPTMVFDEVDSGIGGAVAQIVGRKLRALGAARQVLCVTHLPQVAAQGHAHYRVSKAPVDGITRSAVERLDDAGRERELARMLGGVEVGAEAHAAARRLLDESVAGDTGARDAVAPARRARRSASA